MFQDSTALCLFHIESVCSAYVLQNVCSLWHPNQSKGISNIATPTSLFTAQTKSKHDVSNWTQKV